MNILDSMITIQASTILISHNMFYDNICHGFCIESADSSVFIDPFQVFMKIESVNG